MTTPPNPVLAKFDEWAARQGLSLTEAQREAAHTLLVGMVGHLGTGRGGGKRYVLLMLRDFLDDELPLA